MGPALGGLMHSYHNVAKLRQFRGALSDPEAKPGHSAGPRYAGPHYKGWKTISGSPDPQLPLR